MGSECSSRLGRFGGNAMLLIERSRGNVLFLPIEVGLVLFLAYVMLIAIEVGLRAGALGLIAQHPDAEVVVHALTPPAGRRGVAVDVNAEGGMGEFQVIRLVGGSVRAADHLEVPPVRVQEAPAAPVR